MTVNSALALFSFDHSGAATGHRMVDPDEPVLRVTELAATRGDGIFETVGLSNGRPLKLARHLVRMANSTRMLDLPEQDPAIWSAALHAVADALGPVDEGWVKMVLSRGIEGGTTPTGWAYGMVAASFAHERADGIRVVLLDRGYRHDVATTSPWLLQGAKTISYAVNRSAFREATRRDADDVVFTASDGYLLEGPTANLVLRDGMRLRTPRTDLGILAGTTQAELFAWAEERGYQTSYDLLTPADLAAADAAWLVSSVRLAAPIRSVDGTAKPVDAVLTTAFNEHLRGLTD
ncbi:MAG: aminotransferase class IV [Pseudolysinimonas sp.]